MPEIKENKTLTKTEKAELLLDKPELIIRELNNRSLYHFIQYFWPEVSNDEFKTNWHIPYLCTQLEQLAYRVANKQPKEDLIINIPPGSTKTITVSIMFPVWCWTKWHWMRFITASYSGALSLESAEYSRDLVRSGRFNMLYPELEVKEDKDTKSNFRIVRKDYYMAGRTPRTQYGGNRFSTSVGGTLTGFHGHILIVDDPLNPEKAVSEVELEKANRWVEQTLSTRKTDKAVSPTITVMQRVHQNDPSGHMLAKKKKNLKHISIPGEIKNYKEYLQPKELIQYYKDGLMDPQRMSWEVLEDMLADLGQYGYAGQVGQNPVPPGGGMFKVQNIRVIEQITNPRADIAETVRYWDKAGSENAGAYTAGVKLIKLRSGKFVVADVVRGQWASEEREEIIRQTAEADGKTCKIYVEQEPGSGGKESAEATIRNLAGYAVYRDLPTGDKVHRADPLSVQVNWGNIWMLRGAWNSDYLDEMKNFPFGTYKDQVDASSGAFAKLTSKKMARVIR